MHVNTRMERAHVRVHVCVCVRMHTTMPARVARIRSGVCAECAAAIEQSPPLNNIAPTKEHPGPAECAAAVE